MKNYLKALSLRDLGHMLVGLVLALGALKVLSPAQVQTVVAVEKVLEANLPDAASLSADVSSVDAADVASDTEE